MTQEKIRVGVVGLGRAGWDIHVKRLRDDSRFEIGAVADFEASRRSEAHDEFGCETYTDFESLLKDSNCELVILASPSVQHGPQSIAAMEAGKHVVVEKPMAMSTDEAGLMIDAAAAAGKELFVHQNFRYNPQVAHLREVMASGVLGKIFEIRVRALSFNRRNDWQTLQKLGGGTLNNTCPHYIDVALQLLESPVKQMFSDLKLTTDAGDADDHVKLLLKGENGRVIDIEVSTSCAFSEPRWTLLGTAGTLRSDGKISELKYFDPNELPTLVVDESPPAGRQYGTGEVLPWKEERRPTEGAVPTDFYDNVFAVLREGAAQEITPESVREVIRIIEEAHRDNPL